jgi:N6-L-threonylcarbamoyladenine synthase
MNILAIETSCDDTGIALLEVKNDKKPVFRVLSNVVSSQTIHQQYGGVFPMMAKREHQRNLIPVVAEALTQAKLLKYNRQPLNKKQIQTIKKILEKESGLFEKVTEFLETHDKPDIDAIAVTHGPGLEPCLYVGVNFAKALSYYWNIPLIPVNHIEGHILINLLHNPDIEFPAMSLIVSGGHTQLILVKGIGAYHIIGQTRDDAAGECFDKAAKMLGLGYPGGPIISNIATEYKKSEIKLPRPMIHSKDYDFSFSGLKTAVLYEVKDKALTQAYVGQMCVAIQEAICDVLVKKTLQAAKDFRVKTIILGGGVSANKELRTQLGKKIEKDLPGTQYLIPDASLSTDNGLMIAVTGYFCKSKKIAWQKVSVNANLRVGK